MDNPGRILVFRHGALGDMLSLAPSLWVLREHYPAAHITLLFDKTVGQERINPRMVFEGSGLIDDYLMYPGFPGRYGRVLLPAVLAGLLARLRAGRYDMLVHLARTYNKPAMIQRDVTFFRLAGIPRIMGTENLENLFEQTNIRPLPRVRHQIDLSLLRLAESGFEVPAPGKARVDINIQPVERRRVADWKATLPDDGGRHWVAVGPGSKMPVKVWPVERYAETLERMIAEYDIWPVVFGGREDREKGKYLLERLGRGTIAAGVLSVREAAAAMEECALYLGNDTGTMHLAVAAGVRCVAIFSARDFPGKWDPYGGGHVVLRKSVSCEGCILTECVKEKKRCIMSIGVEEVMNAVRKCGMQYNMTNDKNRI